MKNHCGYFLSLLLYKIRKSLISHNSANIFEIAMKIDSLIYQILFDNFPAELWPLSTCAKSGTSGRDTYRWVHPIFH